MSPEPGIKESPIQSSIFVDGPMKSHVKGIQSALVKSLLFFLSLQKRYTIIDKINTDAVLDDIFYVLTRQLNK